MFIDFFIIALHVVLLLDPGFWLALLAYPYIRQLRKQLHAEKQALKPLLHHAVIHAEPHVRKLAQRIIILHLIAGSVILLGLFFILERCYFRLSIFNTLGTCENTQYQNYFILIPLGLIAYLLYFLWGFFRLLKHSTATK